MAIPRHNVRPNNGIPGAGGYSVYKRVIHTVDYKLS